MPVHDAVDDHVRRLDHALVGPRRLKADILREVRDGLEDAATAYGDERRAVDEFGPVREIAPPFQVELAAAASRSLALRVAAVFALTTVLADLMWRGAPWVGPPPPALYLFLSDAIDRLGIATAVLGFAAVLGLWLAARRGRPVPVRVLRGLGIGIVMLVGLVWGIGTVVFVWSATMWESALSWPPMLIGAALTAVAGAWVGGAAWWCLGSTRGVAVR
jgi:hypothetical protein